MRNLFFVLIVCLMAVSARADVYRWVTDDGTVSYTDSEKRIPEKYKDSAEKVQIPAYSKFTVARAVTPVVPKPIVPLVTKPETCTDPVRITTKVVVDDIAQKRIYVVTDECGNIVFETSYAPKLHIVR